LAEESCWSDAAENNSAPRVIVNTQTVGLVLAFTLARAETTLQATKYILAETTLQATKYILAETTLQATKYILAETTLQATKYILAETTLQATKYILAERYKGQNIF
jgi:hypothetical protein